MSIIQQKIADLAPARTFAVRPVDQDKLQHGIAVKSPNWLGDAVMTLPALQVLKNMLPENAPLVVIAPQQVANLYRLYPGVTYVISIKEAHTAWDKIVFKKLKSFQFKVGVLFSNSLRDAWQMRQAGISELYGRAARCRGFLMKRTFKFPKWQQGMLNESHHANEYLSMVYSMGGLPAKQFMPQLKSRWTMGQMTLKMQSFCQHPRLLLMAPGAAYGAAKRWESANFREVAASYIEKGGIVAVLGSPSERAIGEEVIAGLPENRVFNLAGETSFSDLFNLISHARACVANDSGIMHMAAAMGLPGVAVFGPTDYRATGPVSDKWLLVFDKEPCAPCFKRICPHGGKQCMTKLQPSEVIEALSRL